MTDSEKTDPLPEIPEDLVAVCLDTNSMSRGRLNLDAIADLADVIESQELAVEIWVPEPVLWEWAEHLGATLESARRSYEDARGQANAAGAEALATLPWNRAVDPLEVVEELDTAIGGLDLTAILRLSLNPRAAIDGLRDQILVQNAGRRKSNIKTGAADASSYRLAEAELAKRGGSLLVVSGDQDAKRYFEVRRDVILINSLSRARAAIVAMRTGTEIAAERVQEAINARLPLLTREELGNPTVELQATLEEDSSIPGRLIESTLTLESIDSVGAVLEVDVSHSDGYAAAVATGRVTIERTVQVLNDFNSVVEMNTYVLDGVDALIELSAESANSTDWDITIDNVII